MSKVYVGPSSIAGKGIFAARPLRKGEIAFIAKGKFTDWEVKDEKTSSVGPNWIGIRHNYWLDPIGTNPLTHLNHSCEPNLGIRGRVLFVVLRNIQKGEELAFDYSTTEEDTLWKLPFVCACGSKKCRKSIRSIQFLTKETFKSYLPYIPHYFQKVYLDYNRKA